MAIDDAVVAVFATHAEADAAIRKLAEDGFATKNLSLIGKGYHTEETAGGFYNTGDRMKFWGSRGAFWGGMWGMFFGGLFLTLPVVGPVIVLGYLATVAVAAVEGAIVLGGLGAIGAAISGIGIPRDSVMSYETSIKADDFVVMAHGTQAEVERARAILAFMHPKQLELHLVDPRLSVARQPEAA